MSDAQELERLRFLAMILENITESVVVMDLKGTIQYWNRGAEAQLGYPAAEVLGRPPTLLYAEPPDPQRLPSIFERILGGEDYIQEWEGRRKDGSLVSIDIHARPMTDAGGRAIGILSVSKDAAPRKQSEEELRSAWAREQRAREHAERVSRAHEELTSVVSHDLRTPLSAISVSAKTLRGILGETDLIDPAEAAKHVERIVRSADRMSRLIRGLLDLGRIQAGTVLGDVRVYSAAELLSDASDSLEVVALEKNQRIETAPIDPILCVRCDLDAARQVFSNVIGNALQYSGGGTAVALSARPLSSAFIEFAVEDHGPGIEADVLPHIFDRYWQAKRAGGVGIGLSIVKGIVEAHGGGVRLESKPGRGTTAYFTLPRAPSSLLVR